MKITLITGKQGSGKNSMAYKLIGLGKKFVEINASNLLGKCGFDQLSEEHSNILIIDETTEKNLDNIKNVIINGVIRKKFRKPFTEGIMELHEFRIRELYILSQQDLSVSIRGSFMHIKL